MMNASQQAKQGRALYASKDYAGAVTCFSEAIERADGNDMDLHLYHSNRCAAYQQLGRWREALDDAEATVQIKPGWAKGWSRLGACLERDPRRRGEAAAAYARAAELDPKRPPPRQNDGLDAVTRVRIWYEGLDGLNKAGVWAAALFALYFLSTLMGGSRRGYAPPRRRTYEPSSLGTMGLAGLMLAAWKLPPYFGHQPFLGMGPMQFMWLVQMLTGQRRRGYGGFGRFGRGFGRRRGFF